MLLTSLAHMAVGADPILQSIIVKTMWLCWSLWNKRHVQADPTVGSRSEVQADHSIIFTLEVVSDKLSFTMVSVIVLEDSVSPRRGLWGFCNVSSFHFICIFDPSCKSLHIAAPIKISGGKHPSIF